MAEKVDALKNRRKVLRNAVTRYMNKLETLLASDETVVEQLEEALESLNDKFKSLKITDNEIELLLDATELEKEIEGAEKYADSVVLWKCKANKKIKELNKESLNTKTEENGKTKQNVKLPKLSIPNFYGDIKTWISFWNTFESSIHNNESLSKIDKFNYLRAHLFDTALNTIEGLPISESAYDSAVELLKERFGNTNILIHSYMSNILNIRPLRNSNDVTAFRKFYDKLTTELRSLESLGTQIESMSSILCTSILKAIPQDLLIELNKTENEKGYYDIKTLMYFLCNSLKAREKAILVSNSVFDSGLRKTVHPPNMKMNPRFSNDRIKNVSTARDLLTTNMKENIARPKCPFCNSASHYGSECASAHNLSLEDRKDLLIKKGGCFKCLEMKKHVSRFCKKKVVCDHCSGNHASLMCFKKYKPNLITDKTDESEETENTLISSQYSQNEVYLQTLVTFISYKDKNYPVRVILDTASSKSYISSFVAKRLGLKSQGRTKITHGLFGGSETTVLHNRYSINLRGLKETKTMKIEVMEQEKICATVPKIRDTSCIRELKEKNIFLSDICTKSRNCLYERDINEIHVLLGADVVGKLFTGRIEKLSCGLVAMHTVLGWITMGKINDIERNSSLLVLSLFVNEAKITDLWNLDSLGIIDPVEKQSKEEVQELVMKHFKETVSRENDGRYKVCLPWVNGYPSIPDNKELAEKRLRNNVKSLKSSGLLKDYEQVFNEWEEEGVIEKVKQDVNVPQSVNAHYLPHRAVVKPNSTTKIRPVFDGSAHVKGYLSVNDCIEKGPNLIELIPSVLNRFRVGKIGVTADIRRAFLQISLNERDRDYLRFFWWKDGNPENLIIYRHCRVVFGISCSPFLLAATLMHHLDQAPENVKDVALKLKESMYVDNCVASVDSQEELDYFRTEAQKLLASAKFDLRGWCSSQCAKTGLEIKEKGILNNETESKIPLLGLLWDTERDTLSCDFSNFKVEDGPITKRTILSLTHKIFDPIGFTCPVTLIPKLILQKCWKIKASWDSKLPDEIIKEFEKWKSQISDLKNITIPRRLSHLSLTDSKLSLHIFCDASKVSYASCVFLRTEHSNEVSCQLVQARSRVAPLKKISIPRLELLACCIGTRLADTVIRDLKLENIARFYWSDSMDALYWIKGEGPWATFVCNRVKEIRKLSAPESWNFVPGHMNPADMPSRGCSVNTIAKSQWWLGPTWLLKSEEHWPKSNIVPNMNIVNSEKRKTVISAANLENNKETFYNRYSSYNKILRILAWILRFYKNSKLAQANRKLDQLNNDELQKAEILILKLVQEESFQNSDNRLKCLHSIIDSDGLIRIKTKLFRGDEDFNFRLPIVLPSNHHVVEQLIIWKHRQYGHCGVQHLMTILRENYWILKCRKTVKKVLDKCTICKRFSSKPPEIIEGMLPPDRIRNAAIFEIVGIDLAGPLYLKDESKVWVLLITCAIYRAVHLELLSSLSTDNFILGLTRFISRRGRPSIIYSDRGRNFIGGKNLLENIDFEKLKILSNFSAIEWKLIPPSAPWWGGFWERLVGIMKRILRKVLGKSSLDYEELMTVLCDCESIINSRPLTYISENKDDLRPLTPSMFLQEIPEIGIPELDFLDDKKINRRYLYRIRIRENLRSRFRSEYLGTLRQTLVSPKKSQPLKPGDVVLVWTDSAHRINWPLGLILELMPGHDGVARVAKVKTESGTLIRPVKKLCPLELCDNTELTNFKETVPECVTTRVGRTVRQPSRFKPG